MKETAQRNELLRGSQPDGDAPAAVTLIHRLEMLILNGELASGARLPPERDLMHKFGVSRTVVREAIAGLAGKGLLETRPRFRPVVRKPDYDMALDSLDGVVHRLLQEPEGIRNLYDSRIFFESALVRYAAAHARREDIEELRDALGQNQAAIDDSDVFYATDVEFHGVLYRAPRNPVYPALHRAYVDWLSSHWKEMRRGPEINQLNFAGHKAIFDAIVSRDADAAEHALQRHLHVAWEYVRSTFREVEEPAPSENDHGDADE